MEVVSNTSPVIFLSKIGSLELLDQCFSATFIPEAVLLELRDQPLPAFIQMSAISVYGNAFVSGALGRLHRGELEAMILAQEINADLVVMDDFLARKKAKRLGLRVIGTVGILLLAHRRGLLSATKVEDCLVELTEKHGLYLSAEMLTDIRQSLGRG